VKGQTTSQIALPVSEDDLVTAPPPERALHEGDRVAALPAQGQGVKPFGLQFYGNLPRLLKRAVIFYTASKAMRGLAVRRILGRLRQALLLDPVIPASHGSSSMGVRYIPL
jgi:hypothetical protein